METSSPDDDGGCGRGESCQGEQGPQQGLVRTGGRDRPWRLSLSAAQPGTKSGKPSGGGVGWAAGLGWPPASGPGVNPSPNSPSRCHLVSHK